MFYINFELSAAKSFFYFHRNSSLISYHEIPKLFLLDIYCINELLFELIFPITFAICILFYDKSNFFVKSFIFESSYVY